MNSAFISSLFEQHFLKEKTPSKNDICHFSENLFQLLFPPMAEREFRSVGELQNFANSLKDELSEILKEMSELKGSPEKIATEFINDVPIIYDFLLKDIEAITLGDPAASDTTEVIRTYPGFMAIAYYRVAHVFEKLGVPLIPRILTEFAHARTGIDIHPGAEIGPYFCIDHGTGIVIGGTTKVGKNVKLYQGVTLGALSVKKDMAGIKRHPTIEDNVVIYANATILGGNTIIGSNSIIGGNVWLTRSVPSNSRVYHNAQIRVSQSEDPADIINYSI